MTVEETRRRRQRRLEQLWVLILVLSVIAVAISAWSLVEGFRREGGFAPWMLIPLGSVGIVTVCLTVTTCLRYMMRASMRPQSGSDR
jgi:magnesium-transporting ATPase (P-type)